MAYHIGQTVWTARLLDGAPVAHPWTVHRVTPSGAWILPSHSSAAWEPHEGRRARGWRWISCVSRRYRGTPDEAIEAACYRLRRQIRIVANDLHHALICAQAVRGRVAALDTAADAVEATIDRSHVTSMWATLTMVP